MRFNVRVNFYAQAGSDSGRNPGLITTATGATTAGNTVVGANTKIADYSFSEYTRFYPGFDGIAANGLKYGGFVEVRQDQAQPPGGGINGSISADFLPPLSGLGFPSRRRVQFRNVAFGRRHDPPHDVEYVRGPADLEAHRGLQGISEVRRGRYELPGAGKVAAAGPDKLKPNAGLSL